MKKINVLWGEWGRMRGICGIAISYPLKVFFNLILSVFFFNNLDFSIDKYAGVL
jgi:hypothetical protein